MSPTLRAAIDLAREMCEMPPGAVTLRLTEWVCSATVLFVSLTRDTFDAQGSYCYRFEIRDRLDQRWCVQRVVHQEEPLCFALDLIVEQVRQHTRSHG